MSRGKTKGKGKAALRVRIMFAKTEAMRYTGHLDVLRTWERTLRRAELPLAYTQGFSPHPRIQLAAALPLGFTGEYEIVDVWFEYQVDLTDIKDNLVQAAPPGIRVLNLEIIDLHDPPLQTRVLSGEYIITLLDPILDLTSRVESLLTAKELVREKRGKIYDLRPLIEYLQILPADQEGHKCLQMQLTATEGKTGRPEEVLAALSIPPETTRGARTKIMLSD